MTESQKAASTALIEISKRWAKNRAAESATMCARRRPTEEEIDRATIIGKWFFGWTDDTGPCPIGVSNEHWHKKLCALFEWIAVLETEANEGHKLCSVGVDLANGKDRTAVFRLGLGDVQQPMSSNVPEEK